MNNKVLKEIKKIRDILITKYYPEKIILFGSFAWGKPTQNSDLDIFIIKRVKKPQHERAKDVYRILMNNFSERQLPVDILVHTPAEAKKRLTLKNPFYTQIMNSGKVLYEQGTV